MAYELMKRLFALKETQQLEDLEASLLNVYQQVMNKLTNTQGNAVAADDLAPEIEQFYKDNGIFKKIYNLSDEESIKLQQELSSISENITGFDETAYALITSLATLQYVTLPLARLEKKVHRTEIACDNYQSYVLSKQAQYPAEPIWGKKLEAIHNIQAALTPIKEALKEKDQVLTKDAIAAFEQALDSNTSILEKGESRGKNIVQCLKRFLNQLFSTPIFSVNKWSQMIKNAETHANSEKHQEEPPKPHFRT